MQVPIDFIDNAVIVDTANINFDTFSATYNDMVERGDYDVHKDSKWKAFMRNHGLKKYNIRWYDIYLRMCACGLL